MGLFRDEVYSKYSAKLTRKSKELCFYTKTAQDQDPNDTVEILNDMAPSSYSYSLLCPLSQTLQHVPVRTLSCRHVQTFDLKSCIFSLSILDVVTCYRWVKCDRVDVPVPCPICKSKDKLYIDVVIETFIQSNPGVDRFIFTESGEVVPCINTTPNNMNQTIDLISPDLAASSWSVPSHLNMTPGIERSGNAGARELLSRLDWESPIPFLHSRNQSYSHTPLYNQLTAFPFPLNTEEFPRDGIVFPMRTETARRRCSTVDLVSPTPIV